MYDTVCTCLLIIILYKYAINVHIPHPKDKKKIFFFRHSSSSFFFFSCVRYVIINSMTEAVERTIRSVSHSWYHHHRQNYSNNIGQLSINYININMTSYYSQEEAQYYTFFPSPPPPSPYRVNVLVAFIFPAMVQFMQLMYQASTDKSPFEIHPLKMYFAIASFLIYCFSYEAHLRLIPYSSNHRHRYSNYVKMVQFVGSIFGPLTLACYLSVLLPSLGPFLYSVTILYSAIMLLYTTLLTEKLNWLYHKLINFSSRTPYIIPI